MSNNLSERNKGSWTTKIGVVWNVPERSSNLVQSLRLKHSDDLNYNRAFPWILWICAWLYANFGFLPFIADGAQPELFIFHELCALKKDVGPCKTLKERFYFEIDTGRCESFEFGGCRGNANNFETLEACEGMCLVSGEWLDPFSDFSAGQMWKYDCWYVKNASFFYQESFCIFRATLVFFCGFFAPEASIHIFVRICTFCSLYLLYLVPWSTYSLVTILLVWVLFKTIISHVTSVSK